ncbi:hypothetical protein QL093DRAFT_2449314 [Fusarium oxysporum]|nr:hypothetical protein QL093DRAFT_2449314 [Fusarium oxysporum]
MPAVRRSLQTPDPGKPYLIEGHDEDSYDTLRNIAIEIREAWLYRDNASCIRLAAFSCKILLLIYPLYNSYPLIKAAFLNSKLEELNRLKGKLVRGANLSRREMKFIKALCLGGLYDEWLEAIQRQAKRVFKKTKP